MPIKSRFPLVQEMKQALLSSQPLRENQSVVKFEAELNNYLSDSDYDNCMEDTDQKVLFEAGLSFFVVNRLGLPGCHHEPGTKGKKL
ncbi:unnamed protein product [Allacma fusca]|uniref:Uncharacterized protein n=1 Tax=Allacma fusca TaxID=39272 RepID=A0A8J2JHG1_9HEXA|nr:unnamed protein product [Allacma fusca]